MSKTIDKMRERGVYNAYDFYADKPYISYCTHERRSCIPNGWSVCKRGLNLGQAWYDNGRRSFSAFGNRKQALAEAQEWAGKKFGILEWARDPFGSYGEAAYVKARVKELTKV